LDDLESKNSEEKNEGDKELDDLLCEEDNEFKQKKEEEIIRKKTTMITEDLKASLMQDLDIKKSVVNVKDSNLIAQTNNDKTKPTTESKIVQSKVSAVSPTISTVINSELDKEYYDEKVESKNKNIYFYF
jgi:hypothetical protein